MTANTTRDEHRERDTPRANSDDPEDDVTTRDLAQTTLSALLTIILAALATFALSGLTGGYLHPLSAATAIGLIQLAWVLPTIIIARLRKRTAVVLGTSIGAILVAMFSLIAVPLIARWWAQQAWP